MSRQIGGRVVVITGASSGIGRAAARAFAARGATVVLAARRRAVLDDVATECDALGGRAHVVPTDVTDPAQVYRLARYAVDTLGRIDVWINNAGVSLFARVAGSALDNGICEDWHQVVRTNLFGCYHGARAVVPVFRDQRAGVLINVASVVAIAAQPYTSAYGASKAGIRSLSASLRAELLDVPGVHVCTLLPASIDTPLFHNAANHTGRAVKPLRPVIPAGRVADALVSLVGHPRPEAIVGASGRMLALAHGLAPRLTERGFAAVVERKHLSRRPEAPTHGTLYDPSGARADVSGGWHGGARQQALAGPLLVAALAVALPLTLRMLRQRR